jgi:hypothetical protein
VTVLFSILTWGMVYMFIGLVWGICSVAKYLSLVKVDELTEWELKRKCKQCFICNFTLWFITLPISVLYKTK